MALSAISRNSCLSIRALEDKFKFLRLTPCMAPFDNRRPKTTHRVPKPRLRNPSWLLPKTRVDFAENLTAENREFIREIVQDQTTECLKQSEEIEIENTEWTPRLQRTGLMARKIGVYPLWTKKGVRIQTTLLQVLDNHVIKYYTPEEYQPNLQIRPRVYNKKGCVLIGAEIGDPSNYSREYCGIFKNSGVLPTKYLGRFFVSPDATLPIGTTLNAQHFQVGNYVDVRGKTIDRGFQGVMVRHGFKGMPASHGVTKTHRRGGNIGGGGEKGRVWPGTKMPGHMGNRMRVAKGCRIYRINTKYNVIWVSGQAIPGETNSICYIFDTKLPLRQPKKPLPVPTLLADNENLDEDIYDELIHPFGDPTILYEEQK